MSTKKTESNVFYVILISLFLVYIALYSGGIVRHDNCDDRQIFQFIGWSISEGAIPYMDVWENKGPVIIFFNALAYILCPHSELGVEVLCGLVHVAAFSVLYSSFKQILPARTALLMVLACLAWYISFTDSGNWNTVESLYVVFCALALPLVLRIAFTNKTNCLPCLVLGGILAISMLLKPNFVGVGCFVAVVIFGKGVIGKQWKQALCRFFILVAGWFVVTSSLFVVIYLSGYLYDMLDGTLLFNALDYDYGNECFNHPLLRELDVVVPVPECVHSGSFVKLLVTIGINMCIFSCLCGPIVISVLYTIYLAGKRGGEYLRSTPNAVLISAALLWFGVELAASCIKTHTFKHYYVPMAIPTFILLGYGYTMLKNKWEKCGMIGALTVAFMLFLPFSIRNIIIGEKPLYISTIALVEKLNPEHNPIPTYSGSRICYVLLKCRCRVAQKYTNNRLHFESTSSKERHTEICSDFFKALKANKSSLLLSDLPKEKIPLRDTEVVEMLSGYSLIYSGEGIYVYTSSRELAEYAGEL